MSHKPPAFQFYANDWTSSHTVASMTLHHRGIYITLLAAAWESEEPGTLPLPLEIAAKSARLDIRSLRDFMSKFPRCFVEIDGKLVNEKLHKNWLNYKEISSIRSKVASERHEKERAIAEQVHYPPSSPTPLVVDSAPVPLKRKIFQKPTLMQVVEEMTRRRMTNPREEAEKFIDNHESKGWKINRNPMVSWKAAVGTWQHNLGLFGGNGNGRKADIHDKLQAAGEYALRRAKERDNQASGDDS